MSDTDEEYWIETISNILEDHRVQISEDQLLSVARDVSGAAQVQGESCSGHQLIGLSDPIDSEIARLKKELLNEKNKSMCRNCMGTGRIVMHGVGHDAMSQCPMCDGHGRVYI